MAVVLESWPMPHLEAAVNDFKETKHLVLLILCPDIGNFPFRGNHGINLELVLTFMSWLLRELTRNAAANFQRYF